MKYIGFWIPILKRQYFKFKLMGDIRAIVELEDNIWRSWNLTIDEKREVLKILRGNKYEYNCQL